MRHLMSRETVQEMKVPQADDQSSETSEDGEVIHHMTTETQMIQMGYGDYTEDNSDYQGDDSEGY